MSAVLATPIVYPVHIDWPQVLRDLTDVGVSAYRVALVLEVERSTVQRWTEVRGDIGYGYGRALLALHLKHCGEALTLQRITEAKRRM